MKELCTTSKGFLNKKRRRPQLYRFFCTILHRVYRIVKYYDANAAAFAAASPLLFTEGLAVGALVHGRIGFMGAYQNPVQGTVVFGVTVVSALRDGAFDALVGIAFHIRYLLCLGMGIV